MLRDAELENQARIAKSFERTLVATKSDAWERLDVPGGSISDALFRLMFKATKKHAIVDAPPQAEFWVNYDITKSLSPAYMPPEQFEAAKVIAAAIRVYLAKTIRDRKKLDAESKIVRREVVKMQSVWRRHAAKRRFHNVREEVQREQRSQRAYDSFRNVLLGKGYKLLRWSHSKKTPVPCVVRVDRTREFFLFEQNAIKRKRYAIQDIKAVTKGYHSPFLKEFIAPKEPDKQLSVYFRDRLRHKGDDVSIDLLFDTFDKRPTDDPGAGDGKVRRNRFFNNFCKLQRELESDDAFYFNAEGVYCRVGKSVFERWERVTMVDPLWHGNDEEERRIRASRQHKSSSSSYDDDAAKRRRPGTFEPAPLADYERPQNQGPHSILYVCELDAEDQDIMYGATWFSRAVEIDYGQHAARLAKESAYFRNPMRKERYTLQRCIKKHPGGDFVPQFVFAHPKASRLARDHRRHSRRDRRSKHDKHDAPAKLPVVARLAELKPYFEEKLKEIYGDIGIAGWRNSETGEFEFEDDDWRKLCKIARGLPFNKPAKKAADFLEVAMDEEIDDDPGSPRDAPKYDDAAKNAALQQQRSAPKKDLTTYRKNLLRNMWKEKDQRKGRMWRPSDTTYNTAQKNKIIIERREAEKIAMEEKRRKDVDDRNKPFLGGPAASVMQSGVVYKSHEESGLDSRVPRDVLPRPSPYEMQPLGDDDDDDGLPKLPNARLLRDDDDDDGQPKFRDGRKIDLAVLETSVRKKTHVPLGLKVGALDLADEPLHLRGRKRDVRIACHCALVVHSLTDDAAPSISHAWQNQLLAKKDLIVAVNAKTAENSDDLVLMTKQCRRPRAITLFRLTSLQDQEDVFIAAMDAALQPTSLVDI